MTEDAGNPICMVRVGLRDTPDYPLPEGYRIRKARAGDDNVWIALHEVADIYQKVTETTFHEEFGYDWPGFLDRGFFLDDPQGQTIGTATAWYDDEFGGGGFGRVHWVAIVPEFQGKGLAKPLIGKVLNRLHQDHSAAFLTTSTARIPAINLYLQFGFVPLIGYSSSEQDWEKVRSFVFHPALNPPYLTILDLPGKQ